MHDSSLLQVLGVQVICTPMHLHFKPGPSLQFMLLRNAVSQ